LGPDAEDFLHPTFRDGAKKTLNPMTVQRKCECACTCVFFLRADRLSVRIVSVILRARAILRFRRK